MSEVTPMSAAIDPPALSGAVPDPHGYFTTASLQARYGGVIAFDDDGKPKFERSRIWIDRRQDFDDFPEAIHFGTSTVNHYPKSLVFAWEARNWHRDNKKYMPERKPRRGDASEARLADVGGE